ncbi:MAG: 8-amino-7-oxononanoate synthase [Wenzhouxiangellaceae bacterium]|nr:8-amino-7-oxononanoate synthase [Wenzhouxiangellaceae bacterium]
MRPALAARLAEHRTGRELADRQRARIALKRTGPVTVTDGDRELVNFCGNDYLGLAMHPEIAAAMADCARAGVGSGASALVCGYTPVHRELECRLADFFGFESALLVASGYQANLAIGQALLAPGQPVLADRLNHASLNDGARLADARIRRYRHADAAHAATRCSDPCRWIASDGVFSMDGDLAPLPQLIALAERKNLGLWLDDAHGFGVLGSTGRGIIEHFGACSSNIDAFVVTFGKALGTHGAVIAGDRALIDELVNCGRGIVYSTAMPAPLAAAGTRALEILQSERWRAARLHDNIARFRDRLAGLGQTRLSDPDADPTDPRPRCDPTLRLPASATAIQPIIVGDDARALRLSEGLAEHGFLVRAIRPPSVPEGSARLRITLSAAHAPQQIDALVDSIRKLVT